MTKKTRSYLSSFRKTFFREKYRFDQGNAFLVFLNFALLVVSLVHQGNGDMSWIKYYIIGGFLGTWFWATYSTGLLEFKIFKKGSP